MNKVIGFIILFPIVIIIATIAALLPEKLQTFSGALILVTGVYVYLLAERVGEKARKFLKRK